MQDATNADCPFSFHYW